MGVRLARKLSLLAVSVLAAVVLLEAACQVLFARAVVPQLEARRNDPLHYYAPSDDPRLVYGLKPGYHMKKDGRTLRIDRHGLRNADDEPGGVRPVALLGDSVPFGIGLSQEQTPSAALQRLAGADVRILNFGVPGYGLEEIGRFLERIHPVYRPERIYYVLNLNDFSRRNTVYEGGDNGLFRIYERPFWKLPFFLRKAVYRGIKGGRMSSVRWYRWLYEGNKRELLPQVERMADFAEREGSRFTVVLFPPVVAYGADGRFALQDVFDELGRFLRARRISVIAPVDEFGRDVRGFQDETDHLTPAGSEALARIVWKDMEGP